MAEKPRKEEHGHCPMCQDVIEKGETYCKKHRVWGFRLEGWVTGFICGVGGMLVLLTIRKFLGA